MIAGYYFEIWHVLAKKISDLPINLRYIYKRVSPLAATLTEHLSATSFPAVPWSPIWRGGVLRGGGANRTSVLYHFLLTAVSTTSGLPNVQADPKCLNSINQFVPKHWYLYSHPSLWKPAAIPEVEISPGPPKLSQNEKSFWILSK